MLEVLCVYRKSNVLLVSVSCVCGKIKSVRKSNLLKGDAKSCGACFNKNRFKFTPKKDNPKEYSVWLGIKKRCSNKNEKCYKHYGGRGVQMCPRWKNSFSDFLKDMGKKPFSGYSIDRIDNSGGYYKHNCRWATTKEQSINKRTTIFITVPSGEKKHISQVCSNSEVSVAKARRRIRTGFDPFLSCTIADHHELVLKTGMTDYKWK